MSGNKVWIKYRIKVREKRSAPGLAGFPSKRKSLFLEGVEALLALFVLVFIVGACTAVMTSSVNVSSTKTDSIFSQKPTPTSTPQPTGTLTIYPQYIYCYSDGRCDSPWKDSLDTFCLEPVSGIKDANISYCSFTQLSWDYYSFQPIPVGLYRLKDMGPGGGGIDLGKVEIVADSTTVRHCTLNTYRTGNCTQ